MFRSNVSGAERAGPQKVATDPIRKRNHDFEFEPRIHRTLPVTGGSPPHGVLCSGGEANEDERESIRRFFTGSFSEGHTCHSISANRYGTPPGGKTSVDHDRDR